VHRMILVSRVLVAGMTLLAAPSSRAQDLRGEIEAIVKEYLATHPDDVGEIAKNYLVKHPEAVGEILAEVLKLRPSAKSSASSGAPVGGSAPGGHALVAVDHSAAIASNAALLSSSPHQVILGNPDGDVTLVEFFDYGCGFCKRGVPDMITLIKDDQKLKIVLKEFPILGPGSVAAARVAVAVRMQDPGGQRYLAFHQQLLGDNGPASEEKALAVAKQQGLDMARLQQDMASEEVRATLNETAKLAGAVGITGTPSYVVGKNVLLGAVGIAALKGRIDTARTQGTN
jgi:protein-disulfide isomerase